MKQQKRQDAAGTTIKIEMEGNLMDISMRF